MYMSELKQYKRKFAEPADLKYFRRTVQSRKVILEKFKK